jgi:hypothetical protein
MLFYSTIFCPLSHAFVQIQLSVSLFFPIKACIIAEAGYPRQTHMDDLKSRCIKWNFYRNYPIGYGKGMRMLGIIVLFFVCVVLLYHAIYYACLKLWISYPCF